MACKPPVSSSIAMLLATNMEYVAARAMEPAYTPLADLYVLQLFFGAIHPAVP
jgi:hypothetical protein